MAADRPFPPSTRRLALARAAGLTPASPILVGAVACIAAVAALAALGTALAARLGAWVRTAVGAADGVSLGELLATRTPASSSATIGAAHAATTSVSHAAATGAAHAATGVDAASPAATALVDARDLVSAIIALALPVLGAIAIAATIAHLAQTRAAWIPRRALAGAPVADPQHATRGALALANAAVVGVVTVGWLFAMAPRIAALTLAPRAGALLVASFLAAIAIAWVALGVVDALARHAAHAHALRMTPEDQRADARLAGADPRWRARREKLARGEPAREAIAGASVLVLGDGVAVAVAWDPVHRPIPTRTASGRAARATQLLGLARRYAIAVHRDPELAILLAAGDGPVPEAHWPRLAEIVAAARSRR